MCVYIYTRVTMYICTISVDIITTYSRRPSYTTRLWNNFATLEVNEITWEMIDWRQGASQHLTEIVSIKYACA